MYSRSKIYKLCSSNLEKCYIGSTCNELRCRKKQHEYAWKKFKETNNIKSKITSAQIFEAGGEIIIVLIEQFPCASKMELERRERFHIENNNCVNRQLPAPTREDAKQAMKTYYQEHKEEICQRVKKYREANPEVIKQRKKKYAEANKEVIAQKDKARREANKEVIAQKLKEYYEKNKDKINIRIVCPVCNEEMAKSSLLRHKKRKHTN
jgi:hypothetical protein